MLSPVVLRYLRLRTCAIDAFLISLLITASGFSSYISVSRPRTVFWFVPEQERIEKEVNPLKNLFFDIRLFLQFLVEVRRWNLNRDLRSLLPTTEIQAPKEASAVPVSVLYYFFKIPKHSFEQVKPSIIVYWLLGIKKRQLPLNSKSHRIRNSEIQTTNVRFWWSTLCPASSSGYMKI